MKRMHALCFLLFAAIALASGQIPRSLSYQGVLTDTNGVPNPDGQYIFTFRLYETSTGGSPVGMQQQTLNVRRGLLHTSLDQILANLNVDRPYWLGIQVGGDPELSPRIPLTAVPYSLTSSRADTARYALSAPQQALVDSARIAGTIPNNAVSTGKLQDAAVTSAKIQDGTIQFSDIGQNGAVAGQVMKWDGSAWVPRSDTAGTAGPWQMNGSSVFYSGGFVGVGRSTPLTPSEYFGIEAPVSGGYGGMYIRTPGILTRPFYGYATGTAAAWTYLDGTDGNKWKLFNSGDHLTVDPLGNIGIGTTSPGFPLSFASTVGDKISLYGDSGPHYGIGIQGYQLQIHTAAASDDVLFGYGSSGSFSETMRIKGNGNVGIGTVTPAYKLEIAGSGIVRTRINSDNNAGLALSLNGQPGWSVATVGSGQFQIYNDARGQNAFWIDAFTNQIGVGTTTPGARIHAVDPVLLNDAPGVYGEHAVSDFYGIGVKGVSLWKGVEGIVTTSGSSTYYGVRGQVDQSGSGGTKYGVYGVITGTGGGAKSGVFGEVTGGVGIGVGGSVAANDVNSTGVYGYAQPLGRAVYANGNLVASGAKLFQIDHPLDPANKMLNHYCTEGPEPLNVYSGTVKLDGIGEAWIILPEYFQNINKDFRYQLTPVGASMPDLFVAEEIQGNRFKVGGGKPGMKVSWQVSATRNDLYVQRAGLPVEVEKTSGQRGKYLRPELFGMPESMGIFWTDPSTSKGKSADDK